MVEMVRTYLLTDRERKIAKMSLEENVKLDGLRVLKFKITELDLSRIEEDLELIKRLKEAARAPSLIFFLSRDEHARAIRQWLEPKVILKESIGPDLYLTPRAQAL